MTPVEVIIAVNASQDKTAEIAQEFVELFKTKGWDLKIFELSHPGKTMAINAAESQALGQKKIFLDADVICAPDLIWKTDKALDAQRPVFASGSLIVAPAKSWATKHVAAYWSRLPFAADVVSGAGFYAVNAAGRQRWGAFPKIISDDTYVRSHFAPEEQVLVASTYLWPLPEGLVLLVRVRRRQERGLKQLKRMFHELPKPKRNSVSAHLRVMADLPLSFAVYAFVVVIARAGTLAPKTRIWARSRPTAR